MTALACGIIAVGSCNGDVTSTIVQTIMEKSELELKDTYARWLPLGLGLNHLGMLNGKGEGCLGKGLIILKHFSVHLDDWNILKYWLSIGFSFLFVAPQVKERPSRPPSLPYKWSLNPLGALPTHWWTSVPMQVCQSCFTCILLMQFLRFFSRYSGDAVMGCLCFCEVMLGVPS